MVVWLILVNGPCMVCTGILEVTKGWRVLMDISFDGYGESKSQRWNGCPIVVPYALMMAVGWSLSIIMIVNDVSHGGSEWFSLGGTAIYGTPLACWLLWTFVLLVIFRSYTPYGPLRNRDYHCNDGLLQHGESEYLAQEQHLSTHVVLIVMGVSQLTRWPYSGTRDHR